MCGSFTHHLKHELYFANANCISQKDNSIDYTEIIEITKDDEVDHWCDVSDIKDILGHGIKVKYNLWYTCDMKRATCRPTCPGNYALLNNMTMMETFNDRLTSRADLYNVDAFGNVGICANC